jgi:hypothetical protein
VKNRYDSLNLDVPRTHWTDGLELVDGDGMDAVTRDVIDDL